MGPMMKCLMIVKRAVLCLPIVLVCGLILWSYYTFNFLFIALFVETPIKQAVLSTVYHVVLGLFTASYYLTISTKPANVPSDFRLSDEQVRRLRHEGVVPFLEWKDRSLPIQTRGLEDSIRFCTRCKILKPDRAHHCSVCGVCVLKMDHHCPWVNNCVGWHNYKFFILFLFYGIVYVLCLAVPMGSLFLNYFQGHHKTIYVDPERRHGSAQIVLVCFIGTALGFSMFGLFCMHLYLVATNQTTIESFEKRKNFIRQTKAGWRLPTILENIEEVFGKNRWRWFLPIGAGSQGNGYVFKVNYDSVALAEEGLMLPASGFTSDSDTEG